MSTTKEYLFDVAGAVERLDKVLFALFSDHDELKEISRSQIKNAITKGHVSVNGKAITKAGAEVKPGMQISFRREGYASDKITPFQMQLEILHEDSDLIVINKPAGLSMHPGAGRDQKTLLHGIISKLSDALGDRPGIVHRLDKDTTGIVVVAKNERTLFALSKQFAERTVDRFYTALVVATPRASRLLTQSESGTIDLSIGRDAKNRLKMAVVAEGGKRAVTTWTRIERFNYGILLRLKLGTGRTHQIRVHMAHAKTPVVGDRTYGDATLLPAPLQRAASAFGRQALHASSLSFTHPRTHERLTFAADLPPDFQALVAQFRDA